jgi:DNA-binding cell septation regulator SpoVG
MITRKNAMNMHNGMYLSEPPRIHLRDDPGHPGLRAKVELVLNDGIAVTNIRVLQLGERTIVAFPSRQLTDGRHVDVTYPINQATRLWLEGHILDAYRRATDYAYGWEDPDAERDDDPPASSGGHPTEEVLHEMRRAV